MTYVKTKWIDDFTPVNAKNLNNIENGIEQVEKSIPTKVSQLQNDSGYIDDISGKADITYVDDKNEELSNKINVLSYKYREAPLSALDDLPTLLGITPKNGMIFGTMFSETIAPYLFGGTRYTVEEYYYLPTYRVQIAKGGYQNTGYMKERKMINGVWGEWVGYSTTTKTDISFPYASEFMDAGIHYVSRITKNSMGECTAYIAVKKKDGTNFEPGIFYTIGTPPVGFRPKYGALGISNPIGKHDVGISYTDIVSIGIQTPVSANILLGTIRWECEV